MKADDFDMVLQAASAHLPPVLHSAALGHLQPNANASMPSYEGQGVLLLESLDNHFQLVTSSI